MPQQSTSSIRLLAIRPLIGCDARFLKNLEEGTIYPFYCSARFLNQQKNPVEPAEPVVYIGHERILSRYLYDIEEKGGILDINISAIAGKNGTGKSSLIELLFATIYAFSVTGDILIPNVESVEGMTKYLKNTKKRLTKDIFRTERQIEKLLEKPLPKGNANERDALDSIKNHLSAYYARIAEVNQEIQDIDRKIAHAPEQEKRIKRVLENLKVELYFSLDEKDYIVKVDGEHSQDIGIRQIRGLNDQASISESTITKITKDKLASHFFYTIAVNYSHYSLNSNVLGEWINALFHKNDAYVTPVVINPMRKEGNFNINEEISFAKYRLLSNLLTQQFLNQETVKITDNQSVKCAKFTLNLNKLEKLRNRISAYKPKQATRANTMIEELFKRYFTDQNKPTPETIDFPFKEEFFAYIVQKVDRIAELYPGFEDGFMVSVVANMKRPGEFLDKIANDKTHVTYKLRQVFNFIKKEHAQAKTKRLFTLSEGEEYSTKIFERSLSDLVEWIAPTVTEDIIGGLPPSLFKIDLEIENLSSGATSSFERLSSGEQQLIHSIQSVIYHLGNLQSAHLGDGKRIKYKAVNIVYDEIELYFHPEFQRRFIFELRSAIRQIYRGQSIGIQAVNILFLTHSPFILSDIPRENVLILTTNERTGKSIVKTEFEETFAANINELLANGFFLENALMGTFAEGELHSLISKSHDGGMLNDKDRHLIEMIGDAYLRAGFQQLLKQG